MQKKHRRKNGHFAKIGLTHPNETPKFGFRENFRRAKSRFRKKAVQSRERISLRKEMIAEKNEMNTEYERLADETGSKGKRSLFAERRCFF